MFVLFFFILFILFYSFLFFLQSPKSRSRTLWGVKPTDLQSALSPQQSNKGQDNNNQQSFINISFLYKLQVQVSVHPVRSRTFISQFPKCFTTKLTGLLTYHAQKLPVGVEPTSNDYKSFILAFILQEQNIFVLRIQTNLTLFKALMSQTYFHIPFNM